MSCDPTKVRDRSYYTTLQGMEDKSMQKTVRTNAALLFVVFLIACGCVSFAQSPATQTAVVASDNATHPLVVYYSRTGKARMVATVLKERLSCDMAPIVSKRDIGIGTITLDQMFNRDDAQEPFAHDLTRCNPVIIVAPIWFMKLSSPARTFIARQQGLRGRDLYIITTSGGPMEKKNEAIAKFATDQGLTVKGVFNISGAMRKTQEDFARDVAAIIEKAGLPARAGH